MFDAANELNWLAILVATVAYFVLGAIWFTPLFGKTYDKAIGVYRSRNQKWPPIYYIGPFVSSLVVSIATAVLINAMNISTLSDALTLGLIVGLGYTASISFNNAINPKTPLPLLYGAVTGSYHVVGILIVSAVIFGIK